MIQEGQPRENLEFSCTASTIDLIRSPEWTGGRVIQERRSGRTAGSAGCFLRSASERAACRGSSAKTIWDATRKHPVRTSIPGWNRSLSLMSLPCFTKYLREKEEKASCITGSAPSRFAGVARNKAITAISERSWKSARARSSEASLSAWRCSRSSFWSRISSGSRSGGASASRKRPGQRRPGSAPRSRAARPQTPRARLTSAGRTFMRHAGQIVIR